MAKPQDADSYSSPAMRDRRGRILGAARSLISEQGLDGWSLLELGKRAGVAKQTLYYAFGNKDAVIAAAILDYFEEYERAIPYRARPGTIDRLIERIVAVGHRNLGIRNYVAALVSIYFGGSPQLWQAMHDISAKPHRLVVRALADACELQPWADPAALADMMSGQTFLIANAWLQDRVTSAALTDRMVLAVLAQLAGSVRPATRVRLDRIIARISRTGSEAYVAAL